MGIRCLFFIIIDRRVGGIFIFLVSWLGKGERRGGKKKVCINLFFLLFGFLRYIVGLCFFFIMIWEIEVLGVYLSYLKI